MNDMAELLRGCHHLVDRSETTRYTEKKGESSNEMSVLWP